MKWLNKLKDKIIKRLGGYTADEMQRTLHENALKNEMERQIIKQEHSFVTLTASVKIPERHYLEVNPKMLLAEELAKELVEHDIIRIYAEHKPYSCDVVVEGSLMFASKE